MPASTRKDDVIGGPELETETNSGKFISSLGRNRSLSDVENHVQKKTATNFVCDCCIFMLIWIFLFET